MKDKLLGLALLALVTSAFLFLADLGLGLAGFPSEPPLPAGHAPHFTEHRRNSDFTYTTYTNSQGIRYREIPFENRPGEPRVAVVGDSYAGGLGVDAAHLFTGLLEARAAARGENTLFINCGIIGAGPAQYTRLLERVALKYRPDRVLLVLFANDVVDTEPMTDEELRTGQGWLLPRTTVKKAARTGPKAWTHAAFPRIYALLMAARQRLDSAKPKDLVGNAVRKARQDGLSEERIREWEQSLIPELVEQANQGQFNGYMLTHGLLNPDYWVDALDLPGPLNGKKWHTASAMLTRFARICKERNIPLAVAYAPAPFQHDPAHVSPSVAAGMTFRKEWLTEESELEKRFARWADEEGLPFFNMTPAFREASQRAPGTLNFKYDPHWTPEGNRLAADLLERWLGELGWVGA